MLLEVPIALAFGLAALWLLAPYFGRNHRFRTFLGIWAVLLLSIAFSFTATVGWGLGMEPVASLLDRRHCAATANVGVMALPFLIPLALPAPGLAAAMVLCGLAGRGRYGPFRLSLWLFASLLGVWVGLSALVYGLWRMAAAGDVQYILFLGIGLLMVAVTFVTLLPFLILSSASPFFGERLQVLLCVRTEAQPAIGAVASPAAEAVPQCG